MTIFSPNNLIGFKKKKNFMIINPIYNPTNC